MCFTKDELKYINSRIFGSAVSLIGSNDYTVDYHLNVIETFLYLLEKSNNLESKKQNLNEINSLLKNARKLASGGISLAYLHLEHTQNDEDKK